MLFIHIHVNSKNHSPVTRQQGACSKRLETTTFSTLSSSTSFISLQRGSVADFNSSKDFFSSSDSEILRPIYIV